MATRRKNLGNMVVMPVKKYVNFATVQARTLVRTILAPHKEIGLSTQEIFDAAISQHPHEKTATPLAIRVENGVTQANGLVSKPRYEDHPIRSVR